MNIAAGVGAAGDMDDLQRLRQHGAVGDIDHHAVGHHRAVERDHRIGIVRREQLRLQRGVAGFQHLAQGPDAEALLETAEVGKLWREHAVDQHQPARRLRWHAASAALAAASIAPHPALAPAAAPRASARADRCISSPRSGGAAGPLAHRLRTPPRAPRQPCRCREAGRARSQSCRSARSRSRFLPKPHSSQNPYPAFRPRLRTGRSRKPRAPAPVPCRRF